MRCFPRAFAFAVAVAFAFAFAFAGDFDAAIAAQTPGPDGSPRPEASATIGPSLSASLDDPELRSIATHPIRELAQFGWLVGTWRAHDVRERPDGSSRDAGLNTYVFGPTMNGRYVFGADGKARDFIYFTYDPLAKHWVFLRFESAPTYGIWLSERGWTGNRIVFTSDAAYALGRSFHRRTTIIRNDARAFRMYEEEQLPSGNWTPDGVVEFAKQR